MDIIQTIALVIIGLAVLGAYGRLLNLIEDLQMDRDFLLKRVSELEDQIDKGDKATRKFAIMCAEDVADTTAETL